MRIAQIAPLWETVPPKTYGGTELVVSLLTSELARLGHEVTLFAAKGSSVPNRPNVKLEPFGDGPFRAMKTQMTVYEELRQLERVLTQADRFDIIHNHLVPTALPFASLVQIPMVTTLHGAFKPKAFREFIEDYAHLPYVSISDFQRKPCPQLNYVGTVYHGLLLSDYPSSPINGQRDYLAFLGRFSSEKGPHHAIRVARETGWKLVMAGKVDPVDKEFFIDEIQPHIDGGQIRYIGEVNLPQKIALLGNAAATLCPVVWPEPFGLVLIESLACGTPVLALRDGSIPEIIRHGETGFVADTVEEMISQLGWIAELDRKNCRADVVSRFTVERMTRDYLEIYRTLVEDGGNRIYHTHQQRQSAGDLTGSVPLPGIAPSCKKPVPVLDRVAR